MLGEAEQTEARQWQTCRTGGYGRSLSARSFAAATDGRRDRSTGHERRSGGAVAASGAADLALPLRLHSLRRAAARDMVVQNKSEG